MSRPGRDMSRHDRLMIFGRFPQPGRTKTRLAPALGTEGAADLYRAFLADTVANARELHDVQLELWVEAHPAAARWSSDHYPDLTLRWQSRGRLGDRLRTAFEVAFAEGVERAVALGSDHPTLPCSLLRESFVALIEADVVVGPTVDGGYYAIGFRRSAWPAGTPVFDDMPWSTSDLMARTRARLTRLGMRASELSSWYDVDRPADLERLRRDAAAESQTAHVLRRLFPGESESPKID